MCKESSSSNTQWHKTRVPKAHETQKPKKMGEKTSRRERRRGKWCERGWPARARAEGMSSMIGVFGLNNLESERSCD